MHPSGVAVLVCPSDAAPYQMYMPKAEVFDTVKEHLKTLAPECDRRSWHAWGIDSNFTFPFDAGSAGKYILFGVCNEDGPHAKLARNEHVSAMLEFYTGRRGTFGPFAFVLARVQPGEPGAKSADAEDSDAEMDDEPEDKEDEEVPVDIDCAWPLQRILEHWEEGLCAREERRRAEFARMGANLLLLLDSLAPGLFRPSCVRARACCLSDAVVCQAIKRGTARHVFATARAGVCACQSRLHKNSTKRKTKHAQKLLYMRILVGAVAHMRALALGLLLALVQGDYTRAQEQACTPGSYWDASAAACTDCEAGKYTQEALEFDVSGWCTTNSYTDKDLNGHYVQDGYCYGTPRYSMTDEYGNKWYFYISADPSSSPDYFYLIIGLGADCVSLGSNNYAIITLQYNDVHEYGLDLSKFNSDYSPRQLTFAGVAAARVWAMKCSGETWEWSQYNTPLVLSNFIRTPMNDATSCVSCGVGKYSSATGATSSLTCQSCVFPSFQNNAGASTCSTTTCATNDYLKTTTNVLQVAITHHYTNYYDWIGVYTLHTGTCDGKPVYMFPKGPDPRYLYWIASYTQWAIGSTPCATSRNIYFWQNEELSTKSFDGTTGSVAKMWFGSAWNTRTIHMEIYRSEETGGCEDCPAETPLSPAGSTSVDVCYNGCDPGQASDTDGVCQDCAAGKYQPSSGYTGDCLACPPGATSPPLSTSAGNCSCSGAYEELDASGTGCVCLPGHGRATTTSACLPCANGTFSGANRSDACHACPPGATSPPLSTSVGNCTCPGANEQLDASATGCVCLPGHGRANTTSACLPCANGTFSGANGSNACLACPPGATSPPLSTSAGNCSCQPGYGRTDGSANCSECPAGTYGPSGGAEACQACPETLSSAPGSADVEACGCSESADTGGTGGCVCPPGYGFDSARRCIKCSVGWYGPGEQNGQCKPCLGNMTTLVQHARSQVDCVCLPGHGMTAAGYEGGCTPCAAGTFLANAETLFDVVPDAECTSSCAQMINLEFTATENCALECAQRDSCSFFQTVMPQDKPWCILQRSKNPLRAPDDSWTNLPGSGTCVSTPPINMSTTGSCRRKNRAASSFAALSDLNALEYEKLAGDGYCVSNHGYMIHSLEHRTGDVHMCKSACTAVPECTGISYRYALPAAAMCRLHFQHPVHGVDPIDLIHFANWSIVESDALSMHIEKTNNEPNVSCYRKIRNPPFACIPCARGTTQSFTTQSTCDHCNIGRYQDKRGSAECTTCSPNTASPYQVALHESSCQCQAGYTGISPANCTLCKDGEYSVGMNQTYTLIGAGFCMTRVPGNNASGWLNARVMSVSNNTSEICRLECERYSTCTGFTIQHLQARSICYVFGLNLNTGLPVINDMLAFPLFEPGEMGAFMSPNVDVADNFVFENANTFCYRRDPRPTTDRTCHACPLSGRAPPGSGSEAACVLTRALPAGLNASAWRAQGEGVLLDASAAVLKVQPYNKHEISRGSFNEADLQFWGTPSPTYTCVNITAGIGPLEAQARRQTLSFRTSAGQSTQVLLQEPYARAKATICGINPGNLIYVKSEFTALDAEFDLTFYVGDAGAPPSATVTPLGTPDRGARPHVHAHGHNVSLWGVGGARGVTVLHDYTQDLVYTFARNLTNTSVGAVHRNSTAASADTRLGLWLWAHDAGGDCIEYVHNQGRETVQAHRLPLPAGASVHMLAPDPSNTWVLCVLRLGTELLVLDIHTHQRRQVVGLEPTQYVHAVFAHSASYIYIAYTPRPPPAVTDGTRAAWERYRLDMQQYMVQVQLPVAAEYPPALCAPGSSRDPDVGVCVVCARGSYKDWTGDEGCLPCGPGETTRELGADAGEECSCERGFGRPDRYTGCVPCAAGEFKHRIGDVLCTACLGPHALATGGDGALCACASGWYFDAVGANPHCVQCPQNTYKQDNGTGLCTACGAHMHTLGTASKHAHDCLCDGGHGLGRGTTVRDQIWSFEHIASLTALEAYFAGDGNISHNLDSVSSTASGAGPGAQWQAARADGTGYMSFDVQAPYTHALVHVGNCAESSTVVVELVADGLSRLAEVGPGRNETVCFAVAAQSLIMLKEANAAICLSSRVHLSTLPVPEGECTYAWSTTPPPDYACAACAPGSYAVGETRQLCARCAQGHYAEHPAQSACTQCPDGFFAEHSGGRECELCVFPNATTADRSACAAVPDATADADACANETVVPLDEYVRLRREDLALKTLPELEHSPGGLPHTQV